MDRPPILRRCTLTATVTLAIAAAIGGAALRPAWASEPSFDCSATGLSATERTICTTPALSQLDRRNAEAYERVFNEDFLDNPAQLSAVRGAVRQQEKAWITERNGCGAEVACISDAYQKQIAYLTAILPAGTGAAKVCTAEDVSLLVGVPDAAMHHSGTPFGFANAGDRACTLDGYPMIVLYDESGAPLSAITQSNETSSYLFSSTGIETVILDPGEVAGFGIEFLSSTGDTPCTGFSTIAAFPPGADPATANSGLVSLSWGGAYCGSMTVLPIREGALSQSDY
ncbi:MAG: DUF4232 domain-containing protein [Pseudomonadota bacterium]